MRVPMVSHGWHKARRQNKRSHEVPYVSPKSPDDGALEAEIGRMLRSCVGERSQHQSNSECELCERVDIPDAPVRCTDEEVWHRLG